MNTIYKDNINICVVDGSFLNSGDLSWDPLRQLGNVEIYENTEPEQVISRTYNSDIVITNKTTGKQIVAKCELTDRTKEIILEGGLLNYTKANS